MRCHRYDEAASNVTLFWGGEKFFEKKWDDGGPAYEVCWYQDIADEWKWSWYGIVNMSTGSSTLRLEDFYPVDRPGLQAPQAGWMEVDNILITDDPNCIPYDKGIDGSEDNTIGSNTIVPWDLWEGPGGSAPDFYVKTKIDETWNQSAYWLDDFNVLTDWSATVNVPDDVENVPIVIELWEEDGANDMLCDISSTEKTCNITYNLKNGTWWGDDSLLDTDFIGRTCGEVDGSYSSALDANVYFEVSQNDYDGDGITYWRETSDLVFYGSISPKVKNDRYAIIVGAGAGCKLRQTSNIGSSSSPYKGTYLLYGKGSSWTDYTLYVDMMTNDDNLDGDNEDIGVMFRYQDTNNYYILRWEQNGDNDRMLFQKMINGQCSDLASPKYIELDKNTWYTIKIIADGNHLEVWKNSGGIVWTNIFTVTDSSLSTGSIALFTWKNRGAWFDDVLIANDDDDILLSEGFDNGHYYGWNIVDEEPGKTSDWATTPVITDQEDFYVGPDFIYRTLKFTAHYSEDNIYYLNVDKWRDVTGDGTNDVDKLSTKENIQYAIDTWMVGRADSNDLCLFYLFDHGVGWPFWEIMNNELLKRIIWTHSYITVDSDRAGSTNSKIFDYEINEWLEDVQCDRLTVLVEACYVGHFIDSLANLNKKRISIASTDFYDSASGETGWDLPSFSFTFFNILSSGEKNFLDAFDRGDEHVTVENFLSVYSCKQDARLDDNGDGTGSNYNTPNRKDGELSRQTGL